MNKTIVFSPIKRISFFWCQKLNKPTPWDKLNARANNTNIEILSMYIDDLSKQYKHMYNACGIFLSFRLGIVQGYIILNNRIKSGKTFMGLLRVHPHCAIVFAIFSFDVCCGLMFHVTVPQYQFATSQLQTQSVNVNEA